MSGYSSYLAVYIVSGIYYTYLAMERTRSNDPYMAQIVLESFFVDHLPLRALICLGVYVGGCLV